MVQDSAASSAQLQVYLRSLAMLTLSCSAWLSKRKLGHKSPPTTPSEYKESLGLGQSHFARRYYGNRFCFLFLRLLRCFNSPGSLFLIYEFNKQFFEVALLGNLRFFACFQLLEVFRWLPRPSSSLNAQVSTVNLWLFDLCFLKKPRNLKLRNYSLLNIA